MVSLNHATYRNAHADNHHGLKFHAWRNICPRPDPTTIGNCHLASKVSERHVIVIVVSGTDVDSLTYAAVFSNMNIYLVIYPAILSNPAVLSDCKHPWR